MTRTTGLPTSLSRAVRKLSGVRTMTSAKITLVILGVAVGFAAGCGASRPSNYYQLTVPGDLTPAANSNPVPVTLLIGRLTGPALYSADQIVYSTGSESMGALRVSTLGGTANGDDRRGFLRQLRASGHYRGVYTLRSDIRGEFLLHRPAL